MLIAKWLGLEDHVAVDHCYVTMAGSEMFDVVNLAWVNLKLVSQVRAYEQDASRYVAASVRAAELQELGIKVEAVQADYFTYSRVSDDPHIFYVDLTGVVSASQHVPLFEQWFDRETLRPGDVVLITSSLRIGAGWGRSLDVFRGEFTYLRVETEQERKGLFETLHPAFVLFRALSSAGLDGEVRLRSLGSIRYRSRNVPMGLYGFTCDEGQTDLRTLAIDAGHFDMVRRTVQAFASVGTGLLVSTMWPQGTP